MISFSRISNYLALQRSYFSSAAHFFPVVISWLGILLVLLAGHRFAMLLRYADPLSFSEQVHDIWQCFKLGARFDLKLGSVVTLAFLMPAFFLLMIFRTRHIRFIRAEVLEKYLITFFLAGFALAFFLINFVAIIEYYYFGFYQTPFTPIIFGLITDDTKNILKTVWADYPVIRMILLCLLLTITSLFALLSITRLLNVFMQKYKLSYIVTNIVATLFLLYFARGTFTMFPLNKDDAWFSTNPILNHVVRNAPHALYDSWQELLHNSIDIRSSDEGLLAAGFPNVLNAASVFAGYPITNTLEAKNLFWHTTKGKAQSRPHVVFVMMESWSGYLLENYDRPPATDLLGRLRSHAKRDEWFTTFLPSHGGTHPTLEGLVINTPLTPLTVVNYRKLSFDTAVTWPFKNSGYQTVLVYGGTRNWEEIGDAMPHQGFDNVFSQTDIEKRYKDVRHSDWGVLDEYLFRFADDLLLEAEKESQPLMLFLITTTNHPPFQLPKDRQVTLATNQLRQDTRLPPETIDNVAQTFRYSSDALGAFMDKIVSGPLAAKTLVAATGDHNMRYAFNYRQPRDSFDADRVATYIYVPLNLRSALSIDRKKLYSHQDLFPTLIELALPTGIRYFSGGENLYDPIRDRDWAYCWYSGIYSQQGFATGTLAKPALFHWSEHKLISVEMDDALTNKFHRAKAQLALQDWWIRSRALQSRAPELSMQMLNH